MECEPYIEAVSHRLRKLTEANHSLAEIESLDDLFPRLLDLAKEVTDGEASSLMLYNSESHLLEFASIKDDVMGDRADDVLKSSVKLKMGEGIAGWVAQNRKAVMVKDAQRDPRFSKRADVLQAGRQAERFCHQNNALRTSQSSRRAPGCTQCSQLQGKTFLRNR